MKNRVSIKGRGLDAFFGDAPRDNSSSNHEATPRPTTSSAAPMGSPASHLASELASSLASQTASEPATYPASKQAREPASSPAGKMTVPEQRTQAKILSATTENQRRRLRELVFRDHPKDVGYRFAEDEIDALRDMEYELEVQRGIKVTRNDIVRLALNNLIEEYRQRGNDSLLVEVFKEERRRAR